VSRALVVRRPGGPEAMELVELDPRPVGATELRVAVEAAGVNPVDAGNRADPGWAGIAPPYVVGYELAGTVVEAGAAVTALEPGDPVWAALPVRGTRWGTYAEEVVLDARFVARRPERLDAVQAAAVPLAGSTALQLLDRLAPAPGEWLLVHGAAGGVGHLLVQLARERGARVVAPARPERERLLRELGVEAVVPREDSGAEQNPQGLLFRGEVAMVADLVGGGLLNRSLELLADGGRAASIVELSGDLEEAVDRNVALHGVLVRPGSATLERLAALVEAGTLRPVVDAVHDLADAAAAHRRVETGHGQGKVVLRVGAA
jgi:NADPH2:quinone reductase